MVAAFYLHGWRESIVLFFALGRIKVQYSASSNYMNNRNQLPHAMAPSPYAVGEKYFFTVPHTVKTAFVKSPRVDICQ